ncbi:MAG: hypothetical protein P8K08_19420 [Fuerstiella sp.]|nr:hypothetical protein [Fuerstiella sp.]
MTTMMGHEPAKKGDDGIGRFQLDNQILEANAVCAFDLPVLSGSLPPVG